MGRQKGQGTLQRERNGMYTLRATVNGVRISKSTGTTDLKKAQEFLEEYMRPYVKGDNLRSYHNILAAVATGDARQELAEDRKPQLKVSEAWEAYMKSPERRDLTESTLVNKKFSWDSFAAWLKKHHPEAVEVRHVKKPMVEEYLGDLREGRAASTYNNRVCILREIFRVLASKARCKVNPFDNVKLLNDDAHSRRELTIEELKRLSEVAARVGPEWRKLFAIGIYTGMRVGDCATLLWSEVDVVRSIIQRIFTKTKRFAHGKPTTIPIHPALSDVFQETPVKDRTGYVLPTIAEWYKTPGTGRPKVAYQLKKIFNAAGIVTSVAVEGRRAKAPEATFHSLRHTFVSISANAGVPLHIVQSIVGHESTAMTRHYYHENETALKQAISAIPAIGETEKPRPTLLDARPFSPAAITEASAAAAENAPVPDVEDPAVHERLGGRVATPRSSKSQWMSDCMRIYGKRRGTGIFDSSLSLIRNGGYHFLVELAANGTEMTASEAVDAMEAYVKAKGH